MQTYKFIHSGNVRKQTLTRTATYAQLLDMATHLHSLPLSRIAGLGYVDSDGDAITCTSDADLACLYEEQGDSITIYVNDSGIPLSLPQNAGIGLVTETDSRINTTTHSKPPHASLDSPVYDAHPSFAQVPCLPPHAPGASAELQLYSASRELSGLVECISSKESGVDKLRVKKACFTLQTVLDKAQKLWQDEETKEISINCTVSPSLPPRTTSYLSQDTLPSPPASIRTHPNQQVLLPTQGPVN